MCELFELSSKYPTKAIFSLDEFSRHGAHTERHKGGRGVAFYDDGYAQILRKISPQHLIINSLAN